MESPALDDYSEAAANRIGFTAWREWFNLNLALSDVQMAERRLQWSNLWLPVFPRPQSVSGESRGEMHRKYFYF